MGYQLLVCLIFLNDQSVPDVASVFDFGFGRLSLPSEVCNVLVHSLYFSDMRLIDSFIIVLIILFSEYEIYSHFIICCHARLKDDLAT